jgi:hypothetical protein
VAAKNSVNAPLTGDEEQHMCQPCIDLCNDYCGCLFNFWRTENRFTLAFFLGNVLVAVMGYVRNMNGGFNGWYAMAKTGGYILDLNLSTILIPTLRSVQAGARHVHALDTLFNEDPIHFHIRVAGLVVLGAIMHCIGHGCHCYAIANAPVYRPAMTKKQEVSGMSWGEQLFNHENRFAGLTGILITWLMACMFLTAISHVRRKTFDFASPCSNISGLRDVIGWLALLIVAILSFPMWVPYLIYRRCWLRKTNTKLTKLGGFTVFWQCHKFWKPVFLLLLVHGPDCWIWFLWPLIMVPQSPTGLQQQNDRDQQQCEQSK